MDVFEQLRLSYAAMVAAGTFDQAIQEWRAQSIELDRAETFQALAALCMKGSADSYDVRDQVLRHLCSRALIDERAKVLLYGLFLPALLKVRRRLRNQRAISTEDLAAEILAGFWTGVCTVTPGCTKVSQYLCNTALWNATYVLRVAIRQERSEEFFVDVESLAGTNESFGPIDSDSVELATADRAQLLERAVREEVISDVQLALLRAPRGCLAEVAVRHGLTPRNGRAKRQIAMKCLRRWVARQAQLSRDIS